ncbi:hypothetical protein RKD33_003015 [Streptomyces sp. SAI-129]
MRAGASGYAALAAGGAGRVLLAFRRGVQVVAQFEPPHPALRTSATPRQDDGGHEGLCSQAGLVSCDIEVSACVNEL